MSPATAARVQQAGSRGLPGSPLRQWPFAEPQGAKLEKNLGVIAVVFFTVNFSSFIVQIANQFDTLMLPVGFDDPLLTTLKPSFMNCLVVTNH